jgi:hypothetical protein
MASLKKDVCIDEFLNAVSSTLESKYILIDRKISDILYSIANTRDVYNVIAKCMINFDFIQSWKSAVKSNFIKLPLKDDDRIAFIFCFLSNIDDKNLDITMVLDKYFSYDSETKPFELFCKNIIVEFKMLILKKLNIEGEQEVIFKEEPKQMNEFELLEELIRDFLQIVIVQKKIKKLNIKQEELVMIVQTFEQAVKERNTAYLHSFVLMIKSAISKNRDLKVRFNQIDNLVGDIVGR